MTMIDEKWLDEMKTAIVAHPDGGDARYHVPAETLFDLLRLARLGLWAEKHKETIIGALESFGSGMELSLRSSERGASALAALPKEGG
jgi:hypothetical protein